MSTRPFRPTGAAIKAISFDLDDTLWPIEPVIHRAERVLHDWFERTCPGVSQRYSILDLRALREELAEQCPAQAHDFSAMRRMTLTHVISELNLDPAMADQAYDVFFAARNQVEFFEGAVGVLESLASDRPLACISNGNADVDAIGIGHLFAVRVHAGQAGRPKPHPMPFQTALEALGLAPEEMVHVGDCPRADVSGALGAGCRAIWFNHRGDDRAVPDGVVAIDAIDQLPAAIEVVCEAGR